MNRYRVAGLLATIWLAGCAVEQEYSRTPRTAVEQLLLTQAIERAFHNLHIELPPGAGLEIQATSLDSDRTLVRMTGPDFASAKHPALETTYLRDAVSAVLGRQGYRIPGQEASYLVRVMVESLGTMQGLTFIGLPPIQSTIIPFALPELAIYKFQKQSGYARLHVDMYENETGAFIGSSATIIGRTYYDQITLLFYLTWASTDLLAPP
jgi:hypothetical protein